MKIKNLCKLFDVTLKNYPNNDAVIFYDDPYNISHVSYSSVANESAKVSHCLCKVGVHNKFGVPYQFGGQFVGLYMESTLCLPALIIGILRQGAAFTCFDIGVDGDQRAALTMKHLKIRWMFTVADQVEPFRAVQLGFGKLHCDLLIHGITVQLWAASEDQAFGDFGTGMACAFMTSGTTGEPKCVRVPHECIVPNVQDISSLVGVTSSDVVLLASPLTFDPSIVELFLALSSGAAILIVPKIIKGCPSDLMKVVSPENNEIYAGVTILQTTPSIVARWPLKFIRNVLLGPQSVLKALVLGGEPCPPMNILKLWKGPENKTNIFTIYGLTEVSCWAMIHKVDTEKETAVRIPLGVPLSETQVRIQDEHGAVIKNGEGEISIGSITRVCLIDDEDEKSLPCRVFRATGDIVDVDGDTGDICFVGRKDSIIKRWGHKVNLAQVEQIASKYGGVEWCCCLHENTINKLGLLVQFTKITEHVSLPFKRYLASSIPPPSMPDFVIPVLLIPVTAHGKIDKRKLLWLIREAQIDESAEIKEFGSISGAFEKLWMTYLKCTQICNDDRFVSSGGNSFIALQFVTELESCGYIVSKYLLPMLLKDSTYNECCTCLYSRDTPLVFQNENGSAEGLPVKELLNGAKHINNTGHIQGEKHKDFNNTGQKMECTKRRKMKTTDCENEEQDSDDFIDDANTSSEQEKGGQVSNNVIEPDDPGMDLKNGKQNSDDIVESDDTNTYLEEIEQDSTFVVEKYHSNTGFGQGEQVSTGSRLLFTAGRGNYAYPEPKNIVHDVIKLGNVASLWLEVGWKFDLGKCVDSSPIFVQLKSCSGRVLVGSHSRDFVVLDSATGLPAAPVRHFCGRIESSPCVAPSGLTAVLGCYDGGIHCVALHGPQATVWKHETGAMVKSTPALCLGGSAVVVGSYDGVLYCLRIEDGLLVWSVRLGKGSIYSSPCVSRVHGLVYVATLDGTCCAVGEADGRVVWRKLLKSPVFSSPVLDDGDTQVLFAEVEGTVRGCSAVSGNELWNSKVGGNIFSSFSAVKISPTIQNVFFGSSKKYVFCLEKENSNFFMPKWESKLDSSVYATPFAFAVELYQDGDAANVSKPVLTYLIAVATTKGSVYLIDSRNGAVLSVLKLPGEVFSSPVVTKSQIIVGCRDNNVYSINIRK